jgi:hypothetical protein
MSMNREPMTTEEFEILLAKEPRLQRLLRDAAEADGGGERFCAIEAFDGLKRRIGELVGAFAGLEGKGTPGFVEHQDAIRDAFAALDGFRSADREELYSGRAYELVYDAVREALPPCRGCDHDDD